MANIEAPFSSEQTDPIKKTRRVITLLGWVILIAGFILFRFEEPFLQNSINGGALWLIGLLVGIILFIPIIIFLKRKYTSLFLAERKQRNSIYAIYLIGIICCGFDITGFINTAFANPEIENKKFIVVSKSTSTSRSGVFYNIVCTSAGNNLKMDIDKTSWDKLKEKDTIELYLRKGFFGYNYVAKFDLPNKSD